MDPPSAKRARVDAMPRDPRSRPPVAVGPANTHTAAVVAHMQQTAAAQQAGGTATAARPSSSIITGRLSPEAGLALTATSAQLNPTAHVQLLQRQLAALREERDALEAKRVFWRDETSTQRKYAQELKAALSLAQQKQSGGNNESAAATKAQIDTLRAEVSSLTSDLSKARGERELADQAALILQQALTSLNDKYQAQATQLQTAQNSSKQLEAEVARLQAQVQAAQAAQRLSQPPGPPPPQPQAQVAFAPPYGQPPPSQPYSYGGAQQHQTPHMAYGAPGAGVYPQTTAPGPGPVPGPGPGAPPPTHLPQQPQPPYAQYPPPQPPPPHHSQAPYPQHFAPPQAAAATHPAVAELTQLHAKYESLKGDYNSLIDKYEAQKESLRSQTAALATAQKDTQRDHARISQLHSDVQRVQKALSECDTELTRVKRALSAEHAEYERAKSEWGKMHSLLRADNDRARAESKRSAQLQRTMGEQLDCLIEEKQQLAAQLQALTGSMSHTSATLTAVGGVTPQQLAQRQQAVARIGQQQRDCFSDDFIKIEQTMKGEGEEEHGRAVDTRGTAPAKKQQHTAASAAAAPATAAGSSSLELAADEPEEGEIA